MLLTTHVHAPEETTVQDDLVRLAKGLGAGRWYGIVEGCEGATRCRKKK